uniref:Nonsense-mediated mRNA decay factor SMG8 n=1 Tax=Hirondellea gigas TaxID=1518452 RepID=A0A2P2HYJ9_9CRUS
MKENLSTKLHDGYFTLPCKWNLSTILNDEEKVAVVAIIGQSDVEENCDKTHMISSMLGCNISACSSFEPLQIDESLVHLEGWYDSSRHIIFLHLIGALDVAFLGSGITTVDQLFEEKGSLLAHSKLDQQYTRALLFVFSLSHLVLWCHTSHRFDTAAITTLRTLNNIRLEVLEHASAALQECGVSKGWLNTARLCCPRLLFLFSSRLVDLEQLAQELPLHSDGLPQTDESILRKIEQGIEEQIYRLFRRTWIITNNCNNSIASLPSKQHYVYLSFPHQTQHSPQHLASSRLSSDCSGHTTQGDAMMRSLASVGLSALDHASSLEEEGARISSTVDKTDNVLDALASHLLADDIADVSVNAEHSFSSYLMQHVKQALNSGFDDSISRAAAPVIFLVPKVKQWFAVANRLYSFFITPEKDKRVARGVVKSLTFDSPAVQLMRNSCKEAYEAALHLYTDNLPAHYPQHVHIDRVKKTILKYKDEAYPSPLSASYLQQLKEDCDVVWQRDGKQGCEQLSLSGHICHHSKLHHPTTNDGEVLAHNFGVLFTKFCKCGADVGKLQDSTVLRDLNYTYYAELTQLCCRKLDEWLFPSRETDTQMIYVKATESSDDESKNGDAEATRKCGLSGIGAIVASLQERELKESGLSSNVYRSWNSPSVGDQKIRSQELQQVEASDEGSSDNETVGEDNNASQPDGGTAADTDESEYEDQDTRRKRDDDDDEAYEDDAPEYENSGIQFKDVAPEFEDSALEYEMLDDGNYYHNQYSPEQLEKELFHTSLSDKNVDDASAAGAAEKSRAHRIHSQQQRQEHSEELSYAQNKNQHFQMEPMLCSSSPPGFLPRYSSWSLVCLGSSSIYTHTLGIMGMPGFIPGSHYLLPWDVKMKLNSDDQWTAVYGSRGKKEKTKNGDEFWVKVFIGVEYECSSGHRFLLSTPSTTMICRAGQPTASAHSIATNDMPLYHSCPTCSNSNDVTLGQLMRLHVVTPKTPVTIVLNPQIQPGPAPCPRYYPQDLANPSIKLPTATYWVLRLPNIYVGDTGPYYPPDPSQPVSVENGRLLAGCFTVTEISVDK